MRLCLVIKVFNHRYPDFSKGQHNSEKWDSVLHSKTSSIKTALNFMQGGRNQTDYAPTPELTASFEDELFEDLDVDDESTILTLTSKEDEDEGGSRDEKESGK